MSESPSRCSQEALGPFLCAGRDVHTFLGFCFPVLKSGNESIILIAFPRKHGLTPTPELFGQLLDAGNLSAILVLSCHLTIKWQCASPFTVPCRHTMCPLASCLLPPHPSYGTTAYRTPCWLSTLFY